MSFHQDSHFASRYKPQRTCSSAVNYEFVCFLNLPFALTHLGALGRSDVVWSKHRGCDGQGRRSADLATAMAAEDLGDLQAEILELTHAIRNAGQAECRNVAGAL